MVAAGVALAILIGFRREIGADWWNYIYLLQLIRRLPLHDAVARIEPAFVLLNWIAGRAGWGIWFPNLVCASIFSIGLASFCRVQPNPFLALAVAVPYFVIGVAMGFTRQSAAVGFEMLALIAFFRGNILKTLMLLALATSFHSSAILIVPLLGLVTARRSLLTVIFLTIVTLVLLYLFSTRFQNRLEFYGATRFEGANAIPRLAMNLVPALVYLGLRRRFAETQTERGLWTVFAFAAVASMILPLFLSAWVVADRLGIYLIPLQIRVLTRLPFVVRERGRPSLLLVFAVLIYSAALEVTWLTSGRWAHAWVPYRNYLWDEVSVRSPPRWFQETH